MAVPEQEASGMPSSVIGDYSYDPARRMLTITFVSGAVYEYLDVPPEVHAGLQAAGSRGRFFSAHVRDHYAFRRPGRPPQLRLVE